MLEYPYDFSGYREYSKEFDPDLRPIAHACPGYVGLAVADSR
jgi:hypothetical protein